jgi:hypothetical protein
MTREEANRDPDKLQKCQNTRFKNMALGKHKMKEHEHRPIHCVEDNKTFLSVRLAAKDYGVSHQAIWNAVVGKQISSANRKWRYATADEVLRLIEQLGLV